MTTFGFIMMVVGVAFFSGSAIRVIDRLDRPQQRRRGDQHQLRAQGGHSGVYGGNHAVEQQIAWLSVW